MKVRGEKVEAVVEEESELLVGVIMKDSGPWLLSFVLIAKVMELIGILTK